MGEPGFFMTHWGGTSASKIRKINTQIKIICKLAPSCKCPCLLRRCRRHAALGGDLAWGVIRCRWELTATESKHTMLLSSMDGTLCRRLHWSLLHTSDTSLWVWMWRFLHSVSSVLCRGSINPKVSKQSVQTWLWRPPLLLFTHTHLTSLIAYTFISQSNIYTDFT